MLMMAKGAVALVAVLGIAAAGAEPLFNGRDLTGWYKFLNGRGRDCDPKGVIQVKDGVIAVSGEEYGALVTEKEYSDYRLDVEYRFTGTRFAAKRDKALDSGILFHSTGEDGAFAGAWMCGHEYNLVTGASGDLWTIGDAERRPDVYVDYSRVCDDRQRLCGNKRLPRIDIAPDWEDTPRAKPAWNERPTGEWNTASLVCEGDRAEFWFNGTKINSMLKVSPARGKIQLQSEGCGIEFRRVELTPLPQPAPMTKRVVRPLSGERWWGGATIMGLSQPYRDFAPQDQNVDNFSNQTAPFFVSSAGRYVWSEKPVRWSAKDGVMTFESTAAVDLVEAGSTLKEAVLAASRAHFPPSGEIPPEIFFAKPQWNQGIESLFVGISQYCIEQYACAVVGNGFPMGVFIVDDGWEKDFGVWEFDRIKFPDPKGMVEKLHNLGAKVMLWIVPYVSGDYREVLDMHAKGYLVKCPPENRRHDAQGDQAIVKWWSGYSHSYDMSVPAAREHLAGILDGLCRDYGVEGFKFDGADIWHYALGSPTGVRFGAPGYTAVDNCRDWSLFSERWPYNEICGSYNTAGRAIVQRLQDKAHSWDAVRQLVPDMLAAGILGYAYTCADMIGGGLAGSFQAKDYKFNEKIFVRSCQTHALMPMMQFSLAPWRVLSPGNLAICRDAANLHCAFAPYILGYARHAAKTGEPIVRYMEYEFPHQGFEEVNDQFMLGGDWLVAPILNDEDARTVRLPGGEWRDDLGEVHIGPKTLELKDVPLARLPRFRRVK